MTSREHAASQGGWFRVRAHGWEAIVGAIAHPWPVAAVEADLEWWADRQRMGRGKRPGRPSLRRRWGWTDHAVRSMLREWHRRQPAASRPPAGRQPAASRPPAASWTNLANGAETASPSPADRQRAASGPPVCLLTRGGDRQQTQTTDTDKTNTSDGPNRQPTPPAEGAAGAAMASGGQPGLPGLEQPPPRKARPAVPDGWEEVHAAYVAYRQASGVRVSAVRATSGQGRQLKKLLKAHGAAVVVRVLTWLAQSSEGRAPYYRDSRRDAVTIRRNWEAVCTDATESFPLRRRCRRDREQAKLEQQYQTAVYAAQRARQPVPDRAEWLSQRRTA